MLGVYMTKRRCCHCRCRFSPKTHVPNQKYCSDKLCQAARKRRWRKQRLAKDPDYHSNQRSAQQKWQLKNQDYWRRYRASHPKYVDRNRELSRKRAQMKRHQLGFGGNLGEALRFAKSDASMPIKPLTSMGYEIILVRQDEFAKMDVSKMKTVYLSMVWRGNLGELRVCKEMT